MTSTTLTGSCVCGAIKYELSGPPSKCVMCHCNNCQKATGSAFTSNCFVAQEQLEILQGNDSLKTYNDRKTGSGQTLQHSFCGVCGSRLFLGGDRLEQAGLVGVTSGSIDNREDLVPSQEYFCRSRRRWLSVGIEGIESLETQ